MFELLAAIPFSFAALFPVVNPIGSSFVILSIVEGSSTKELNWLAMKIAIYAAIMLIVTLVIGSGLLRVFGITIPIVMIGGGLVLAQIGWQILTQQKTQDQKDNQKIQQAAENTNLQTMAFYPLTMPVTAGPGVLAVAIALGAHASRDSLDDMLLSQGGNAIGIILVSITIYFCYRYAHVITAKIGETGTAVIMRMAGFLNFCIGLELIWHGIAMLIKH